MSEKQAYFAKLETAKANLEEKQDRIYYENERKKTACFLTKAKRTETNDY